MKAPVADIVVGDRVRQNIDDGIGDLCNSIRELGQLQPILVDKDFNLIAGARRLRACELLGIEVAIFTCNGIDDALKRLKAERDENHCRKPWTPSEWVEIGKRIEAIEGPEAGKRKGTRTDLEPASNLDAGRTDEKVASAIGVGKDTYRKAKAVVAASEDESLPEAAREAAKEAVKQMDATGKVDPAFKAVKAAREPKPEAKPEIKVQGVGVTRANEAINCLIRIPKNDALRSRGMQIVKDWIKANS
jgi:ParB family chromosome partitioning protein